MTGGRIAEACVYFEDSPDQFADYYTVVLGDSFAHCHYVDDSGREKCDTWPLRKIHHIEHGR